MQPWPDALTSTRIHCRRSNAYEIAVFSKIKNSAQNGGVVSGTSI